MRQTLQAKTQRVSSGFVSRRCGVYLLTALIVAMVSACSRTSYLPVEHSKGEAALYADHILTADGYRLPLRQWLSKQSPSAVVLGLHGFGDYGAAFGALEHALVETGGMNLYAYDQRGFGETQSEGLWAGREILVQDALTAMTLLRARYPDTPLYLIGDSMGGAIALLSAHEAADFVDGILLIAPAVWSATAMPWYQRLGLWLVVRVAPGVRFSGDTPARFGIRPTDDREVMRSMSEDPLMQRNARGDTLHGLTELMGEAARVDNIPLPTLVLYGLNDQIIPLRATCEWFERIFSQQQNPGMLRAVLYPDGYHMLTRYSGSEAVHSDIAIWLQDAKAALPSGHEGDSAEILSVCDARL